MPDLSYAGHKFLGRLRAQRPIRKLQAYRAVSRLLHVVLSCGGSRFSRRDHGGPLVMTGRGGFGNKCQVSSILADFSPRISLGARPPAGAVVVSFFLVEVLRNMSSSTPSPTTPPNASLPIKALKGPTADPSLSTSNQPHTIGHPPYLIHSLRHSFI
ncbi:uncharacterized protein LY79DRAFT_305118 [Colletotrichum navitas]|uniref:Uncharacterized protein n=1 Tax=Colletotrichum navitas TaxID=681940 RepID=A0AAD8PUB7_9PEZI|nr:uncharacterized protein LY79DRAFT_305118 [Colletotrichum navitas]KAK1580377.1 hypothetical protein LY79DRAFT_305118 [Colletotrichum navitas]